LAEWGESETWSDHRVSRAPALAGQGILVALGTPSLGLAYYRLRTAVVAPPGTEDGSDPAREDPGAAVSLDGLLMQQAAVAFVQPFVGGLTLGTVLKYVRGTTAREAGDPAVGSADLLDRAGRLEGDADSAFDLDLALMAVAGRLRIGLVGHNLRTPTLTSPGGPAVELERQVRAGLAWAGDSGFTVAADLDLTKIDTVFGERRMLALGAQQRLGEWLGIRGGGRFNLQDEDADPAGAVGVSVAVGSVFWVDAQMTRGGPRGSERGWGVSGRLGF
jgi:hypothetical protein